MANCAMYVTNTMTVSEFVFRSSPAASIPFLPGSSISRNTRSNDADSCQRKRSASQNTVTITSVCRSRKYLPMNETSSSASRLSSSTTAIRYTAALFPNVVSDRFLSFPLIFFIITHLRENIKRYHANLSATKTHPQLGVRKASGAKELKLNFPRDVADMRALFSRDSGGATITESAAKPKRTRSER